MDLFVGLGFWYFGLSRQPAMRVAAPLFWQKCVEVSNSVYEPDSRQIREVTVTEDFLWE
jgi:hypothetical protein